MNPRYRHPQFNTVGLVAYYKLWSGLFDGTNVFDYAFGGFTGVPGGTDIAPAYPGFAFNGSDDHIDFGIGPTVVKSIIIWIKPNATAVEEVIDLNNTDYIEINTGNIVLTGFATGTQIEYVNEAVTAAVTTDWQMVTVTDSIGRNASAGFIGVTVVGVNFFAGSIGETMLFDRVLTPAEIKSIYELTKWRYPNN